MSDLLTILDAGIARHVVDSDGDCAVCCCVNGSPWPCETVKALRGMRVLVEKMRDIAGGCPHTDEKDGGCCAGSDAEEALAQAEKEMSE